MSNTDSITITQTSSYALVQISGTINSVGPRENISNDRYIQRLILRNVTSVRHQVNSTVAVVLEFDSGVSIPFRVGAPITCRGKYQPASVSRLPVLTDAYKPLGFVRYQGVIYS